MRWQLALDLKLLIPLTVQWGESQNFKSTGHDNNTKCLLSECKQFHGSMLHDLVAVVVAVAVVVVVP